MRIALVCILAISFCIPELALAEPQRVQLGLYRQETAAVDGWQLLKGRFPALLADRMPELEPVDTEAGTLLRLMVAMEDEASARTLQEALNGDDVPPAESGDSASVRPQLASSGRFTVTAGGVPGQQGGFVFGRDRVYVGLRAETGRVAFTPGLASTTSGDVGPYAGVEVRW